MQRYTMLLDGKNIVKMAILHKAIYRFKTICIKLPIIFSIELEQILIIFKFIWKNKDSKLPKQS